MQLNTAARWRAHHRIPGTVRVNARGAKYLAGNEQRCQIQTLSTDLATLLKLSQFRFKYINETRTGCCCFLFFLSSPGTTLQLGSQPLLDEFRKQVWSTRCQCVTPDCAAPGSSKTAPESLPSVTALWHAQAQLWWTWARYTSRYTLLTKPWHRTPWLRHAFLNLSEDIQVNDVVASLSQATSVNTSIRVQDDFLKKSDVSQ